LSFAGRSLSYAALVERMDRAAAAASHDLRAGGVVALIAPNCLEFIELACGLPEAAIAVAPINPRLTLPEIEAILGDSGARAAFVHKSVADEFGEGLRQLLDRVIVLGSDYEAWLARARPVPPEAAVSELDIFSIPYTSGTTGRPKGVMLSHRSRVLTFFGMAVEYGCYGPEDRFLAVAPLCHGAGFAFAVAALFFGARCDLLSGFDPEHVLKRLEGDGISGVFMVPTHFSAIFGLGERRLCRHSAPALKSIISNASALPQATKERIVALWGEGLLHETYGSTEAGIVTNLRPPDQLRKQQSVGQPFVGTEIRLLDDQGIPVGAGEVGELFSRSPTLFSGYLGKPEETAASVRDGWFTAGDLARADEEGYYSIVGRRKDMVISGGFNIYPREIEEVLATHPAVREAAVVGMPDPHWGESVVALVAPFPGRPLDWGEMERFCRERLAGYKLPRRWEAIDRLPRNAVGKVLKTALRARLLEQLHS